MTFVATFFVEMEKVFAISSFDSTGKTIFSWESIEQKTIHLSIIVC
jgi:hypothetical protein